MIHSLWRWLVVAAAVLALAGAAAASGGRPSGWATRSGLIYTITLDVQVLIGLIIWVGRGWWQGEPFYAYIHPLIMLLALGVAHMARGREKRARAARRPARGVLFIYGASLLLVVLGIPWNR